MRKLLLVLLITAVLCSASLYFLSMRAPGLLRESLSRALHKTVKIESIEYQFPWTFILEGFQILEAHDPFVGEVCFSVDRVLLDVSPLSIASRQLILDNVEVNQALVVVRNHQGRLSHALSDASAKGDGIESPMGEPADDVVNRQTLPLQIKRFHLEDSHFRYLDYAVQSSGFVIQMDEIEANIKDLAVPASPGQKTYYRVEAKMPQGKQEILGMFQLSGWTRFEDLESDLKFSAVHVSLPYFSPYTKQLTSAEIEEGLMSAKVAVTVHAKRLVAHSDVELSALYVQSFEEEGQLFGLKADEVLGFFKDRAGKLKFQVVVEWPVGDPSVSRKTLIRRAIEKSIKTSLVQNMGVVLEKTIQKISDGGFEASKDEFQDALKKVKKLFG